MHWKELHEQSKVVDLHNHAVLKRFLLDRDMSGSKTKFLAKLFKRGFWPLSQRSNFPLIEKGGVVQQPDGSFNVANGPNEIGNQHEQYN